MAELSDLQLATLLDEIASAIRVGTPIVDTVERLNQRHLRHVAAAAHSISEALQRGEDIADAVGSIDSPYREQAAAAVSVAAKNGDTDAIERLSRLLRTRTEYSRRVRLGWFYPLMLLVIGYGVGVIVMGPLVRRFQGQGVDWPEPVLATFQWLESYWFVAPVVVGLLIAVVWIAFCTGHRFPKPARLSLFCRSLADQLTHDVVAEDAIGRAAKLSGDQALQSLASPNLDTPAIRSVLSVGHAPEIPGAGTKEALIAKLRYAATVYAERDRLHSYLWTRLAPRAAMVAVGVSMILSYVWYVIAPVYQQVAEW